MSSKAVRFEPLSLSVLALLAGSLVTFGCHQGSSPTAPEDPFASSSPTQAFSASARQPKTDVCHVEGAGGHHPINVAAPAVPAHLGHGDWLVTDEVCDGVDNDCDGLVDEDGVCEVEPSCPCYSAQDLASTVWTSAGLAICVDTPPVASITDIGNGNIVQNSGPPATSSLECSIQVVAGPTAGLSSVVTGLDQDDWDACNDLVRDQQAQLGASCFFF